MANEKIITMMANELEIVWGSDRRYWKPYDPQANFAELLQVAWLEISGKPDEKKLKFNQKYKISFRVSMTPDAFGWNNTPVYIMAKLGKTGKYKAVKVDLAAKGEQEISIPEQGLVIETTDREKNIYFGLYEIWRGNWKGGLRIHRAQLEEVV